MWPLPACIAERGCCKPTVRCVWTSFLFSSRASFHPREAAWEKDFSGLPLSVSSGWGCAWGARQGIAFPSFLLPQAGCGRLASLSGFWELPLLTLHRPNAGQRTAVSSPKVLRCPAWLSYALSCCPLSKLSSNFPV